MKPLVITFIVGLWIGGLAVILVLCNNPWLVGTLTRFIGWCRSKLGNKKAP